MPHLRYSLKIWLAINCLKLGVVPVLTVTLGMDSIVMTSMNAELEMVVVVQGPWSSVLTL